MTLSPEQSEALQKAISEFVGAFEVVFHYDWDYTSIMIGGEEPSFIQPGLTSNEESEDWGARGALLERYRNMVAAMKAAGLSPVFPVSIENLASTPVEL
ncbi:MULTISPECIES: hypothetical protein [unclassified Pseudomonas]|uniref:hypothetical protein n=1 Tax=unclassified Pseudomonas TaxID=196821 RepID=UPI0024489D08|nr:MULTISPECIES: hypothetical protein [unclassified Pseudomonas]MDH0894473.1 hypothetical protein [Pseudomonas sp. GD03875]MDH1063232.1 hypothetical protein [Pseudomonas sp. GD03985]